MEPSRGAPPKSSKLPVKLLESRRRSKPPTESEEGPSRGPSRGGPRDPPCWGPPLQGTVPLEEAVEPVKAEGPPLEGSPSSEASEGGPEKGRTESESLLAPTPPAEDVGVITEELLLDGYRSNTPAQAPPPSRPSRGAPRGGAPQWRAGTAAASALCCAAAAAAAADGVGEPRASCRALLLRSQRADVRGPWGPHSAGDCRAPEEDSG